MALAGVAEELKEDEMRRFGALVNIAALFFALVVSNPAAAFGGWHGGGWHGGGWGGWRGGGWGWRGGWNGGWNRWNYWNGWGGTWGWGWGAGLLGSGLGWSYPHFGYDYYFPSYYYPNYAYLYPNYGYVAPAAPIVTGRSVAAAGLGGLCATPLRTCQLVHASFVGGGCSCRVAGGRARGSVVP
jgi:hypothetical protein